MNESMSRLKWKALADSVAADELEPDQLPMNQNPIIDQAAVCKDKFKELTQSQNDSLDVIKEEQGNF